MSSRTREEVSNLFCSLGQVAIRFFASPRQKAVALRQAVLEFSWVLKKDKVMDKVETVVVE